MVALANSPETSHDGPGGRRRRPHQFETSRPLPSYLVAFAVGDFDVVQGQTSPFPIRVVTTKGKGGLTSLALEASAALIAKLGDYFDIRYPYAKLDIVAVPDFAAGAMENPGLVTFRDDLLLLDPKHATTQSRRAQAEVIAHEFAHQWFGDLVTAQWWDDIWLNEGFATWAEAKMVDAWKPSFGATLEQVAGVQHVMDTDALRSARAVREPVRTTGEAMESFDGITYEKGAAVLRMIEAWLGPDVFRRGVQRYVHENAWKNAARGRPLQGARLRLRAEGRRARQRLPRQAGGALGAPQLEVRRRHGTQVELRQSEWRPLGRGTRSRRARGRSRCASSSDAQKAKSCFTLGSEPIDARPRARCPTWVYPNAEEAGYYRFVLDAGAAARADAQPARSSTPPIALGLLSNAWAAVRQGAIEPGTLLDVLPLVRRREQPPRRRAD